MSATSIKAIGETIAIDHRDGATVERKTYDIAGAWRLVAQLKRAIHRAEEHGT